MKNKIGKTIVLFFVIAMFLIMSISAHAETGSRYFFSSESLPSEIPLEGVTITPTNINGELRNDTRKVFNEDVAYFARVHSSKAGTTRFMINAQSKGVLLVYYARSYDDEPIPNDGKDLKIENKTGIVENYEITSTNCYGVKYYIIETGTYTMTAQNATCGVYGFVYMPGNVATYYVKGDVSLMGQYCKDDYSNLVIPTKKDWHFCGWYSDEANTTKVKEEGAITEPTVLFAHWTRCVWDFNEYSGITIDYHQLSLDYEGILIKGSKKK